MTSAGIPAYATDSPHAVTTDAGIRHLCQIGTRQHLLRNQRQPSHSCEGLRDTAGCGCCLVLPVVLLLIVACSRGGVLPMCGLVVIVVVPLGFVVLVVVVVVVAGEWWPGSGVAQHLHGPDGLQVLLVQQAGPDRAAAACGPGLCCMQKALLPGRQHGTVSVAAAAWQSAGRPITRRPRRPAPVPAPSSPGPAGGSPAQVPRQFEGAGPDQSSRRLRYRRTRWYRRRLTGGVPPDAPVAADVTRWACLLSFAPSRPASASTVGKRVRT